LEKESTQLQVATPTATLTDSVRFRLLTNKPYERFIDPLVYSSLEVTIGVQQWEKSVFFMDENLTVDNL
jgi:hypothetical protein